MTKQEKIIVSAYTGVLMCDFDDVHEYIQKKLGRPVYTHELADKGIQKEVKEKSHEDFLEICNREELEPHWIPCSERLPEENGQYLITVKYKHVNDSYEDVYAEHGEWFDGKWDMFCFGHCGEVEDIIAWMPLPEPYKG